MGVLDERGELHASVPEPSVAIPARASPRTAFPARAKSNGPGGRSILDLPDLAKDGIREFFKFARGDYVSCHTFHGDLRGTVFGCAFDHHCYLLRFDDSPATYWNSNGELHGGDWLYADDSRLEEMRLVKRHRTE